MNVAIIVGNLGRDPELRYTQDGKAVCRLSVATTDGKHTEWHDVVAFDKQAQACGEYLQKGAKVCVNGRIQTRSWEDPNTGSRRYRTEVIASRVEFLGSSTRRDESSEGASRTRREPSNDECDDDIPF